MHATALDYFAENALHDVVISGIEFNSFNQTLIFHSNDINWNYEGFEKYYKRPANFIFLGVNELTLDISGPSDYWIYDSFVSQVNDHYRVDLFLSEGFGLRTSEKVEPNISFCFQSIELVDGASLG